MSTHPVLVFDGDCPLCQRGARVFHRFDSKGHLRFTAAQGPFVRALSSHWQSEVSKRMLLWDRGRIYAGDRAVLRAIAFCSWPWFFGIVLLLIPRSWRRTCYDRIARRRRSLQVSHCNLLTPSFRRVWWR